MSIMSKATNTGNAFPIKAAPAFFTELEQS